MHSLTLLSIDRYIISLHTYLHVSVYSLRKKGAGALLGDGAHSPTLVVISHRVRLFQLTARLLVGKSMQPQNERAGTLLGDGTHTPTLFVLSLHLHLFQLTAHLLVGKIACTASERGGSTSGG